MALDTDRRAAQTALQEKQARRNALAKEIGQGKRSGADTAALEAEATALRGDMDRLEKRAAGPRCRHPSHPGESAERPGCLGSRWPR